MSYDSDQSHLIWVSDLDNYVNLDGIFSEHDAEQQEEALNEALDEIGDIALFAKRTISSRTLYSRGISPEKWRWMQHDAETSLGHAEATAEIEAAFLKAVIASGRRYAIARYACSEHLSFSSAVTATFPHGIRALIYQYMAGEASLADRSGQKLIQQAFQDAISKSELTAYDRVALVRQRLHRLADAATGPNGHLSLSKEGMRNILALCRLHFAFIECRVRSISELIDLNRRYDLERTATERNFNQDHVITGKYIRNWKVRYQRPLVYFFPYSTRNALTRAVRQADESRISLDRATAVNELACL